MASELQAAMTARTTDRIRLLRKRPLEADEAKLLDDIETHGCHIIQVREEQGTPGWSYTIGLYDTLRKPEVVVVGLKNNVAISLLNNSARRLREGACFEEGHRERELLANVECEFRIVERRWLRQVMGYAIWFYGGDEFPVVQCIYPDLGNHFPWEEGFDSSWRNRQPLLAGDFGSSVDQDFWAANDPSSSLYHWKFTEPPHTGVFTTKRVMSNEDPVTRVFHDVEDGAWQFHGPGESSSEDLTYVCFHHIVDKDPTIKELADLPLGWCAWREKASSPWIRDQSLDDPEES